MYFVGQVGQGLSDIPLGYNIGIALCDHAFAFILKNHFGSGNYRVAYAIADSPLGPFEKRGIILQTDPNIGTGAGHHSVIRNPKSGKYYIVYHRHPLGAKDGNNRVTCIDEMHFDAQGNILPIKMTFEGVKADKLK